jgi:hypothetical protein
VVSPILANLYLHEVLDVWFIRDVLPRLKGKAFLIRYADSAVLVFASERDAKRVMEVLPKRFGKYGLSLHPEKTKLVDFKRPNNSIAHSSDPFHYCNRVKLLNIFEEEQMLSRQACCKSRMMALLMAVVALLASAAIAGVN